MAGTKLHPVAYQKALKTKPPKHMRVNGDGKPGQQFSIGRLEKLCAKYGVDPAEIAVMAIAPKKVLAKMGLSAEISDKERLDVAIRLMEYTYAKRKAVEVSGEVKEKVTFVIEN